MIVVLFIIACLAIVIGGLYAARLADEWEEERELEWRYQESMRRAGEALDEEISSASGSGVRRSA